LEVQFTLLQPGGQIMPTTLLLAYLDLKTQRHLCICYDFFIVSFSAAKTMKGDFSLVKAENYKKNVKANIIKYS
jgi:hypothetical protein